MWEVYEVAAWIVNTSTTYALKVVSAAACADLGAVFYKQMLT